MNVGPGRVLPSVRHLGLLACVALLLPACGAVGRAGGGATGSADTGPDTGAVERFALEHGLDDLARATVRIEGPDRRLVLDVVVADSPASRPRGLQGVLQVPDGVGMLFVFPDEVEVPVRPGFWMLGTLVALDIVFADRGTVVGVATMTPCAARPCPVTHPGVPYDVALEVGAGRLLAAGVAPGDRLTWVPLDGAG
jgi:uncharacterized membrane protein (UPF0127 family)